MAAAGLQLSLRGVASIVLLTTVFSPAGMPQTKWWIWLLRILLRTICVADWINSNCSISYKLLQNPLDATNWSQPGGSYDPVFRRSASRRWWLPGAKFAAYTCLFHYTVPASFFQRQTTSSLLQKFSIVTFSKGSRKPSRVERRQRPLLHSGSKPDHDVWLGGQTGSVDAGKLCVFHGTVEVVGVGRFSISIFLDKDIF